MLLFGSCLWPTSSARRADLLDARRRHDRAPAADGPAQQHDDARHLADGLRAELRRFFIQRKELNRADRDKKIIALLSPMLKMRAVKKQCEWLRCIPYLRTAQLQLIAQIEGRLRGQVYPPTEEITWSDTLRYLGSGIEPRGHVMRMGSFWGTDFVMLNPELKNRTVVNPLTYVEILDLGRKDFFELLAVPRGAPRGAPRADPLLLRARHHVCRARAHARASRCRGTTRVPGALRRRARGAKKRRRARARTRSCTRSTTTTRASRAARARAHAARTCTRSTAATAARTRRPTAREQQPRRPRARRADPRAAAERGRGPAVDRERREPLAVGRRHAEPPTPNPGSPAGLRARTPAHVVAHPSQMSMTPGGGSVGRRPSQGGGAAVPALARGSSAASGGPRPRCARSSSPRPRSRSRRATHEAAQAAVATARDVVAAGGRARGPRRERRRERGRRLGGLARAAGRARRAAAAPRAARRLPRPRASEGAPRPTNALAVEAATPLAAAGARDGPKPDVELPRRIELRARGGRAARAAAPVSVVTRFLLRILLPARGHACGASALAVTWVFRSGISARGRGGGRAGRQHVAQRAGGGRAP